MARPVPWRPRGDDYSRVFREQNPWHQRPHSVPEKLAYQIERPIVDVLARELLDPTRSRLSVLLGPRRVGKTVSMYQTVRRLMRAGITPGRLWWLHMAHPLLTRLQLGELVRLVLEASGATDDNPVFLFVDEITYARDWALWLKTIHDERWPVRLLGTSSAAAALRQQRQESGVGRWDEHYLSPYLFDEFLGLVDQRPEVPTGSTLGETIRLCLAEAPNLPDLSSRRRRYMLMGGFPELLLRGRQRELSDVSTDDDASLLIESQRTLGADAVQRAIYMDIPQVFGIDNPMVLERLLYVLGGQITGIMSPTSICQELDGLSQPTFDRYVSYLERSFLIFTIQNYAATEAGKQKRGRKLFFVDGAVRNAALQRGIAPLNDTAEMGLLLENLVAAHLHALGQQTSVRVHYWRDRRQQELDLIYDHPTDPIAIEVGSSIAHPRQGVRAFLQTFGRRFGGRTFIAAPDAPIQSPEHNSDGIGSLPLDLLLVMAGRAAVADSVSTRRPRPAADSPSLFDSPGEA